MAQRSARRSARGRGKLELGAEPEDSRQIGEEDEAAGREELARLRALVPKDLRPVFDLRRMEGYTNDEITRRIGRVARTVELKLQTIRAVLGPHLEAPRGVP